MWGKRSNGATAAGALTDGTPKTKTKNYSLSNAVAATQEAHIYSHSSILYSNTHFILAGYRKPETSWQQLVLRSNLPTFSYDMVVTKTKRGTIPKFICVNVPE